MKRSALIGLLAAVVLMLSLPVNGQSEETMTVRGDIIDTMCLTAHSDNLAEFVKGHTKQCVLMPSCVNSGMNIVQADGTVLKLDEESAKKVVEFLKQDDANLKIIAKVQKNDDGTYRLISIDNQ